MFYSLAHLSIDAHTATGHAATNPSIPARGAFSKSSLLRVYLH
jgi:hypothetical protein